MVASLAKIGTESRRHRVAKAIREAIFSGGLNPGDRLIELELAAQLGTSRAPVREALRQLELEGLVVIYPYRGTEVLGASQDEIEQVLVPIRIVVESFAFKKAMLILTESNFAELEQLVREMERAALKNDPIALTDADIRFHELVVELSGQQHCLQIWRTIQPRVRSYFRRDAPQQGHSESIAGQHWLLLEALRSRDPERVSETIRDHITTFLREAKTPDTPA